MGTDALIKRYFAIVMARPDEVFPLRRLADLYRQRDGNLAQLITELEQRVAAGGTEAWSARVALAGVYRLDNKKAEAIRLYREAVQQRPNALGAVRALAEAVLDDGDLAEARGLFDQVLANSTERVDKEAALRTLIRISLDQKDHTAAKRYHEQLVSLAQGSIFVRAELGREYLQRDEFALAEAEYRQLVKAAAGDNRALAPALRDLGQVLVRQRKTAEAIEVLRRALQVAGQGAGVRREIHALITEAYRAEGKLPELIVLLESSRTHDFDEVVTLGLLLEETGQVDRALDVYRRALHLNPRHIDTHLKIIHLLQAQGELDQAIRQFEALIRAVPGNPDFSLELCEILIQRGDRAKALALLTRLEQQIRDEDQLGRLADFYERIEEKDRATRLLQRLAQGGGRDPRYIIDLGDRYFQQGDKKKAMETWARLRTVITNRAEALATLGEVYLDHDMTNEALEALREAVSLEPNQLRFLKTLAIALERTGSTMTRRRVLTGAHAEALQIWGKILDMAYRAQDEAQAREARVHIVSLWALSDQLGAQVSPLSAKFSANPPDIQAGRMLVEVQIRLRQLAEAEQTLSRLTQLRPGEADLFLTLERVYVLQRKIDEAIDVLAKLTSIDPKRARQYYQRMAQYAAELYRDDDAVKYAAQAVALAPDDAEGHRKLGEMYRKRQDTEQAVAEFRAAITKNDRLFLVYFDLAELLLSKGQTDEADQLYRRVVRLCPDEEMVARAARLSMQINLGKNSLEVLERELLPTALGNPQKRVYRRLLVDLYGVMTFPLVQDVRYGSKASSLAAREQLSKIGARAVKPLLDALADENEAQQRIAIEVLAFVQNRSAAPALFAFATGSAEPELRSRAMLACGALRDPGLLPRYASILSPTDDSSVLLGGSIALAATWGVARSGDPGARPVLRQLAKQGSPEIRALALLGLGFDKGSQSAALLAETTRSVEAGNVAIAAAALGLSEAGATDRASALVAVYRSSDPLPQQAALVALARLAPERARPLLTGFFDPNVATRKATLAAALVVATGQFKRSIDPWEVPAGQLDVHALLDHLMPSGYDRSDYARVLVELEEQVGASALQAVRSSAEGARLVADALLSYDGDYALAPFTDGVDKLDPDFRKRVRAAAQRVTARVEPAFLSLVRHPSVDLRTRTIRVLARQNTAQSRAAVIDALEDDNELVQRAALTALGEQGADEGIQALCKTLLEGSSWSLRLRAARALGLLNPENTSSQAVQALSRAARQDSFALVREASLTALVRIAHSQAQPIVREAAASDQEPAIRKLASQLLQSY